MNNYLASVVIPVHNQYSSLQKVLAAFNFQTASTNNFEIIVVDDGSTDELSNMTTTALFKTTNMHVKLIHQENRGRAVARNIGVLNSESNIVIFCDGDRFPNSIFVEQHLKSHCKDASIVIGSSYDYFGNVNNFSNMCIDWEYVRKFSRLPMYFKKISSIYNENGDTHSNIAWLSFLVGNSSIKKCIFEKANGFNEVFREWGFEHFDIGLRMQNLGFYPHLNMQAANYHIPHPRPTCFYSNMIQSNIELFSQLHPNINCEVIGKLLISNIEINDAEQNIFR